ncbi:MAG: hypothetical protein FGM33_08330 [Candidatus Kapabacteria bacterium]|nr:hypothetical protein [Candidatus Kapabacteria bacterium]
MRPVGLTTRLTAVSLLALFAVGMYQLSANVEEPGKLLADRYCQSCHVKPLPEHLDKATWLSKVFPMMRQYMGLDQRTDRELLPHDLLAMYPTIPAMTEDDWFTVANWYVDNAPDTLPDPPPVTVSGTTSLFDVSSLMGQADMPMTILVRFDTTTGSIITGDALLGMLNVYDVKGALRHSIDVGGPPSCVEVRPNGWYVTNMGKLLPHDSAAGSVVWVSRAGSGYSVRTIIDSLRRPTHVSAADLNGDSREDLVVCEYGNLLGRIGWFESRPKGWRYHELAPLPGAIRTVIRDINADGRPDVVALMAQAREGIFAYINRGKGRFESRELVTFPPSYGSSSFSFADINADGKDELIITTGDNGDYVMPPYKPYHGVYVYASDASGRWQQRQWKHLDGAYGAIARDFDRNGSLDLLSYSYFPRLDRGDYDLLRFDSEAFGTGSSTWSVPRAEVGRWLVSDVADIDGDGDVDVALGNVSIGPGRITDEQSEGWRRGRVRAIFLRNTTRN